MLMYAREEDFSTREYSEKREFSTTSGTYIGIAGTSWGSLGGRDHDDKLPCCEARGPHFRTGVGLFSFRQDEGISDGASPVYAAAMKDNEEVL